MTGEVVSTEMYTAEEVAQRFIVDKRTVYRWLKAGTLRGIRTPGGHHRIPGSEIMRLFEDLMEDPE